MPNFYKIEISPILNMSEDPYFDFDKAIVKKKWNQVYYLLFREIKPQPKYIQLYESSFLEQPLTRWCVWSLNL